jgi:uncharacterized protein
MTKPVSTGESTHWVRNLDSFTRLQQRSEGRLAIAGLERLADLVHSPEGDLHYVVTGRTLNGADGLVLRKLELEVTGVVWLQGAEPGTLQQHELNLKRRLVLVRTEAELPPLEAEPDDEDYLVADRELDLAALVEDEVLLDLPVFVDAQSAQAAAVTTVSGERPAAAKISPFASLATLKKPNH